jgi:hypothetical protein
MLLGLLICACLMCGLYGRRILSKAGILHTQAKLMAYSDVSDIPVYAEIDTKAMAAFTTKFPTLQLRRMTWGYEREDVRRFGRVPPDWRWLRAQLRTGKWDFPPEGTVFCGGLRSQSGCVRLVAVDISRDHRYYQGGPFTCALLAFEVDSIRPEGLFAPAACRESFVYNRNSSGGILAMTEFFFENLPDDDGVIIELHAGIVDSEDPSYFRSKVTIGGRHMQLVGRLHDDGTVGLSVDGLAVGYDK